MFGCKKEIARLNAGWESANLELFRQAMMFKEGWEKVNRELADLQQKYDALIKEQGSDTRTEDI